jgi:hypothetical protein
MGMGLALLGRLPKQAHRFGVISSYPSALGIHDPQIVLSQGIALLGCSAIPTHRFGVISSYPSALGIHDPQIVLSRGIALRSSLTVPAYRLSIIFGYTVAPLVQYPYVILGRNITLLSQWTPFTESGRVVLTVAGSPTALKSIHNVRIPSDDPLWLILCRTGGNGNAQCESNDVH